MVRKRTGPRTFELDEHKLKVVLLEKRISPDGLPINPPKLSPTDLQHGWYRYEWISTNDWKRHASWFRVGPA